MDLTIKECELLYKMFNASISNALNSGIPIGKEYYNIIDSLREKIQQEEIDARRRHHNGSID